MPLNIVYTGSPHFRMLVMISSCIIVIKQKYIEYKKKRNAFKKFLKLNLI